MTEPKYRDPYYFNEHGIFTEKPVIEVVVQDPPIGNKIVCIKERGIFVLERGPVLWRAMACTHAGTGGVTVHDGIPDADGQFAKEDKPVLVLPENPTEEQVEALNIQFQRQQLEHLWNYNGRLIYMANPACMGMWMFDAGLTRGLTVVSAGATQGTAPYMSITWMKVKVKAK